MDYSLAPIIAIQVGSHTIPHLNAAPSAQSQWSAATLPLCSSSIVPAAEQAGKQAGNKQLLVKGHPAALQQLDGACSEGV